MRVVIEFHRIRPVDDARAKVGRACWDVIGTEAAIELATSLLSTHVMPQEPDLVTISDDQGIVFYRARVGYGDDTGGRDTPADHKGISVWENEGGAGVAAATANVTFPDLP